MGPDRLIRAAASDNRIQVIALDLEKFDGAGQPTLEELARALREFRASGKKVIAYGTELTQERYYLAAQADELYLDPMGFVLIDGYDRYRMYFKDALDKLGVDINVFRVGAFKSAVETYTRNEHVARGPRGEPGLPRALWSDLPGRGDARAQAAGRRARAVCQQPAKTCRRPAAMRRRWP